MLYIYYYRKITLYEKNYHSDFSKYLFLISAKVLATKQRFKHMPFWQKGLEKFEKCCKNFSICRSFFTSFLLGFTNVKTLNLMHTLNYGSLLVQIKKLERKTFCTTLLTAIWKFSLFLLNLKKKLTYLMTSSKKLPPFWNFFLPFLIILT